jgi:hypothetical protein
MSGFKPDQRSVRLRPEQAKTFIVSEPFRHNAVPVTWDVVRSGDTAEDCFADEIAIDFPSLDHVVERIRDAFLEERPGADVLSTELQLSIGEARRGLIVPLDVPMRRTCRPCGGRGETWTTPCGAGVGTGRGCRRRTVSISRELPGCPVGSRRASGRDSLVSGVTRRHGFPR